MESSHIYAELRWPYIFWYENERKVYADFGLTKSLHTFRYVTKVYADFSTERSPQLFSHVKKIKKDFQHLTSQH